jgi:hypothetical protein
MRRPSVTPTVRRKIRMAGWYWRKANTWQNKRYPGVRLTYRQIREFEAGGETT